MAILYLILGVAIIISISISCQNLYTNLLIFKKLTHHNLCIYLQNPTDVKSLIGLGLNFFVQLSRSTGYINVILKCVKKFWRNLFTQVFFTEEACNHDATQIFKEFDWCHNKDKILIELRAQINYFRDS